MTNKKTHEDFQNNLWTLLSSSVSAIFNMVLIFITVRTVGLEETGILSFAVAVVVLIQVLVIFGVRQIQSTDIKQEYSLNTYLGLRVFSILIASSVTLLFLVLSRFDAIRVIIILLLYFIYLTDGFADVFMGDLQQKGKMRIAGRMRVCAFGSCMVAFAITSYLVRSLTIALIVSGLVILLVYIIWIWVNRRRFECVFMKFDTLPVKTLMLAVIPLLFASLINGFLLNSQKYFLAFLDTDTSVAIITILIIPITFLNIICSSLFYGAEMTKTAKILVGGHIDQMKRRINKQFLIATGLSATFLLCSYFFGIPLLSWVFNTNLQPYVIVYMLLTLGGASFSYIAVLTAALVTMRLQKTLLINYSIVAILSGLLLLFLVSQYGINGAAYSFLVVFVPMVISLYMIYYRAIKKMNG
jgi:O-antigen/teichoic acid export membrane protein